MRIDLSHTSAPETVEIAMPSGVVRVQVNASVNGLRSDVVQMDATPNTGQTVSTNEMRQALKATLPSYMVPSILMQLPQLPATPNGKVDRKALPAPNLDELARSTPFTAPTTATGSPGTRTSSPLDPNE